MRIWKYFTLVLFITSLCTAQLTKLRIGSFKIYPFGYDQQEEIIVNTLVDIIRRNDIFFLQSVDTESEEPFLTLLSELNKKENNEYDALIYNVTGIALPEEVSVFFFRKKYVYIKKEERFPDRKGWFTKPPFLVEFEIGTPQFYGNFEFTAVGAEIFPDTFKQKTYKELDHLYDVYASIMMDNRYSSKNVIFMGDMSAGEYILPEQWKSVRLRRDKSLKWLIDDNTDTTISRTNSANDRFVVNSYLTANASVFKFDEEFKLDKRFVLERITDHYPIEMTISLKSERGGLYGSYFIIALIVSIIILFVLVISIAIVVQYIKYHEYRSQRLYTNLNY